MPALIRNGHPVADRPRPADAGDDTKARALRGLRHEDPAARCLAADVLAAHAASRAEDPLIEALQDADAAVREAAARALGRCGGAPALTALLDGVRGGRLRPRRPRYRAEPADDAQPLPAVHPVV